MRTARWRLVVEADTGLRRLFDLERDPAELDDVAAAHPEAVEELATALAQQEERDRALRAHLGVEAQAQPLELEVLEELRALGYIDSPTRP